MGLRAFDSCMGLMRIRGAIFASVTVLVIASASPSSSNANTVSAPFDSAAVDRFITTQMARHHIPGLAVAITQGNRVVHSRGFGEAHDGQPVTGQTQFRIASLSKSMTALAVLQLVEVGQISLDAPRLCRW